MSIIRFDALDSPPLIHHVWKMLRSVQAVRIIVNIIVNISGFSILY